MYATQPTVMIVIRFVHRTLYTLERPNTLIEAPVVS